MTFQLKIIAYLRHWLLMGFSAVLMERSGKTCYGQISVMISDIIFW